jgi:glycosyltransferase involved in cell wall biosynthesis
MRILHTVEYYFPSVGGAQEVVRQISERLVKKGHEVTVATKALPARSETIINGVTVKEFAIFGTPGLGYQGEVGKYQEFLLKGQFDVMMNYAAEQWATDLAFSVLEQIPYAKILAPCGFSGLYNRKYAQYYIKLPNFLNKYDCLIFHSSGYRDVEFVKNQGLQNCRIIPNGASAEEFLSPDLTFRSRYHIPETATLILSIGSHTGAKGHYELIEAFRRTKIKNAYLVIIGNVINGIGCSRSCRQQAGWVNLLSFGAKRIVLLDLPRQDVLAALYAADLFVLASNLECSPLVLFESMASRTPFISTACGNAAEIVEWGKGGVIVPTITDSNGLVRTTPDHLANEIQNLLAHSDRRFFLGEMGFESWQDRFTWEKIVDQYEQLYIDSARQR